MNRPQNRYSQLFAILKRHGLDKDEVLADFDPSKKGLTELSDGELKELILRLVRTYGNKLPDDWQPPPGDEMRKKVIAIAINMRWTKPNPNPLRRHEPVVDMDRIDQFCISRGKYKKRLNEHSPEELQKLLFQFQKAESDFYKGLNR